MPALPSSVLEALWVQVAALLPTRQDTHPPGCHRPRIPDRIVFDKLIQVPVFGCGTAAPPITAARRPPAPPPRRVDRPGPDRAAAPCGARRLRPAVRPGTGAPGGGRLQHQSALRRPDRRAQPDGPPQTGAEPVGGHRRGRHFRWRRRRPRPTTAPTGCWPPPLDAVGPLGPPPQRPPCTGTPAMTTRRAGRSCASGAWPARSPQVASPHRCRPAAAGPKSAPRVGQPGRHAALVHRTPPAGGRVLAGAGQRHHRLRPAGPPRLGLLSLGQPTPPPPITSRRRP